VDRPVPSGDPTLSSDRGRGCWRRWRRCCATARRFSSSAASLRSLLDGINSRLDESHDISRYLIGLLVFLGLLGTFWGLLKTIDGVAGTLSTISVAGDATQLFDQLKAGLQAPLAGMGTAFSSSLLGLAGSLVLGFLELQASQAHNRFFNELEDWLAGQTRLSSGGPLGDGEQPIPAYIQALLEQPRTAWTICSAP
jgi:hypothetical protein